MRAFQPCEAGNPCAVPRCLPHAGHNVATGSLLKRPLCQGCECMRALWSGSSIQPVKHASVAGTHTDLDDLLISHAVNLH